MKLSALMIVNAIIAAVFGLGFVFAPGQVLSFYSPEFGSLETSAVISLVAQLFGAALLAFGILTWAARNAPDSETRRAILLALFVGDGVGFFVALLGQLGGEINALGWSTVTIYALFAVGFGYFRFLAKQEPIQPGVPVT